MSIKPFIESVLPLQSLPAPPRLHHLEGKPEIFDNHPRIGVAFEGSVQQPGYQTISLD